MYNGKFLKISGSSVGCEMTLFNHIYVWIFSISSYNANSLTNANSLKNIIISVQTHVQTLVKKQFPKCSTTGQLYGIVQSYGIGNNFINRVELWL